ncbi:hypothetical protein EG359_17385 [Chryseobacterium joostei]|uniref:Uncharacterized protein n=1 Tax=Chryseobacterium joostei TaxID=112234 RepID=A0A1N7IB24_9FLAO|nr:hypothetical protein [Chryseobacterium joostei]AZB01277.1 hypothetical protein EG359_17385 [Chryseobacterium joostei]SIS34269.1 hypothetical protein SAMN05421768_103677 [Chryseobacterium joostei]
MKSFKKSLLDLFNLNSKEEIVNELHDLIDGHKSSIATRLEREFIFTDYDTKEFVATDCFITPPMKGEYYVTNRAIYEVLQVTHAASSLRTPGTIQVRKQREFKTAG